MARRRPSDAQKRFLSLLIMRGGSVLQGSLYGTESSCERQGWVTAGPRNAGGCRLWTITDAGRAAMAGTMPF